MTRFHRFILLTAICLVYLWPVLHWTPQRAVAQTSGDVGTYTVAPGDTFFEIAARFGISADELARINNINNINLLAVGQVLLIPGSAAAGLLAPPTRTVLALPGDTLSMVALRYKLDTVTLATLNSIDTNSRLFPGQPLKVPESVELPAPLNFGAVVRVNIPETLTQGKTGKIVVDTMRPLSLSATWNGLPLAFTQSGNNLLQQFALAPVPALIAPGPYILEISYTASNGASLSKSWTITVSDGGYERQSIVLPPDRGDLLDPPLVQAELEKVTSLWSQVNPTLIWPNSFQRPIGTEYPTTSPFGIVRSYNGGPYSSYHAGQDFGAPAGVPVIVPGDGTVVLAEPLTVRGTAVIIDHGLGIFSGYWHLSELMVAPGQEVRAGDILGLVGNTGLSTGAHLHWELRILGIAVDPMQFIDEPFAPAPR
jgi:murein DD-endopeptidase MepM/ murein hydrolase activator NlpD